MLRERFFNIGFGEPISVRELAKAVSELAGFNSEIFYDKPRLGDIKHSYADISKAEKLLGYKPRFSLRDGLRVLLDENVLPVSEVGEFSNVEA